MEDECFCRVFEYVDDCIVVGWVVDGDVEVFVVFVCRYMFMMCVYMQWMFNFFVDVDDIVQELFVIVWQRFGEFEDFLKVKSWLMWIVSCKVVDWICVFCFVVDIDFIDCFVLLYMFLLVVVEMWVGVVVLGVVLCEFLDVQCECWVLWEIGGYFYEEIVEEFDILVLIV